MSNSSTLIGNALQDFYDARVSPDIRNLKRGDAAKVAIHAAREGHVETLEFIKTSFAEKGGFDFSAAVMVDGNSRNIVNEAAAAGHKAVLHFLKDEGVYLGAMAEDPLHPKPFKAEGSFATRQSPAHIARTNGHTSLALEITALAEQQAAAAKVASASR